MMAADTKMSLASLRLQTQSGLQLSVAFVILSIVLKNHKYDAHQF